jgi:hypothetical protein
MSIARDKIVELQEGVKKDENNGLFVGEPIDVWYDYKKLGIWQGAFEEPKQYRKTHRSKKSNSQ